MFSVVSYKGDEVTKQICLDDLSVTYKSIDLISYLFIGEFIACNFLHFRLLEDADSTVRL